MRERQRRVGLNETVFRELNERLEDLADAFAPERPSLDLVCECGDGDCAERIRMQRSEYEALRADATHFAVVPGHEDASSERVVEQRSGYDVVEKTPPGPRQLAEDTDPRVG
jgi:hypothetical protein